MDLNRIILIGRMASDPELKYTPSGIPVSQFRLAVNRPMSAEARQNGQEKQADFISIVAWRQSAEYAANYLGKGRLVAIEGRLQIREYEHNGQKRRDSEVVVDNLKSLDRPKDENGAAGGGSYGGGGYSRGNEAHEAEEYPEEPAPAPAPVRAAAPQRPATPAPTPARRPAPAAPPSGGRYAAPPPEDDLDDPFADN